MVPWKDLETAARFNTSAFACAKGGMHNVWGLNLYQIDVPTLVSAVEYMDRVYAEYPDFREAFLAIDLYADRVTRSVPDDATAYPYRNALARLYVKDFPTSPIPLPLSSLPPRSNQDKRKEKKN